MQRVLAAVGIAALLVVVRFAPVAVAARAGVAATLTATVILSLLA